MTMPADIKATNKDKTAKQLQIELETELKSKLTRSTTDSNLSTTFIARTALTASRPHYFLYDAKRKELKNIPIDDSNEPIPTESDNKTLQGKPKTFRLVTELRRQDSKSSSHVWSPVFVYITNPATEENALGVDSTSIRTPLLPK